MGFDDDETGKISFKNLKRVAKELGERMTDEELQEMIDEADRDGDGEVNEEEFLRIMKKTNLFLALAAPPGSPIRAGRHRCLWRESMPVRACTPMIGDRASRTPHTLFPLSLVVSFSL